MTHASSAATTSLGPPRVPGVLPLTICAALAAAEYTTVIALLPRFAPDAPVGLTAASLAAFHAPSLVVNFVLQLVKQPHPSTAIFIAVVIQILSSASMVVAAALGPHRHSLIVLTIALGLAGTGAALFQSQLLNHIARFLMDANFLHDMGVHLSVVETASSLFASLAPLLAALMIINLRLPLYVPFIVFTIAMSTTLSSVFSKFSRLTNGHQTNTGCLLDTPGSALSSPETTTLDTTNACRQNQTSIASLILRPSVLVTILEMIMAAAATSFVLPLLAYHVVNDLKATVLVSAALFAVLQMSAFVSNAMVTTLFYPRFGRRAVILGALSVSCLGFRLMSTSSWLSASVILMALGAHGALVLSLGRFAETAQIDLIEDNKILSYSGFLFTSCGELLGILAATFFSIKFRSFNSVAEKWSSVLFIFIVLCLVPDLIAVCLSCLSRCYAALTVPMNRSRENGGESQPLLTA